MPSVPESIETENNPDASPAVLEETLERDRLINLEMDNKSRSNAVQSPTEEIILYQELSAYLSSWQRQNSD